MAAVGVAVSVIPLGDSATRRLRTSQPSRLSRSQPVVKIRQKARPQPAPQPPVPMTQLPPMHRRPSSGNMQPAQHTQPPPVRSANRVSHSHISTQPLPSRSEGAVEPVGMTRAKCWSTEVENAFRVQEAGYRSIEEYVALGLAEPARWPDTGFIRKLQTRHSFDNGGYIVLYFRQTPECEPRYVNRVKLFRYA